jgi:fructose-specific PTS system IIA-like component
MPLEYRFICPLPNGVHARPASALEAVTRDFTSEVVLLNERTRHPANSKSILDLLSADIRLNDPCVIKITGPDESEALSAVSSFLRDRFPHCDDALPAEAKAADQSQLPPSLPAAGITIRHGEPVVPGIGWGKVVRAGQFSIPPSLPTDRVTDAGTEQQKVEAALRQLVAWYDQRMAAAGKGVEGELLGAHRAMARDQTLRQFLFDAIAGRRRTAAGAIVDAEAGFSAKLAASENALLRERVLDVQDVCIHLLHLIYGQSAVMPDTALKEDSIVVAENLVRNTKNFKRGQ